MKATELLYGITKSVQMTHRKGTQGIYQGVNNMVRTLQQ